MPTPIPFVFSEEEKSLAMEEGMRRQGVNEARGFVGAMVAHGKGAKR
jgi:hypothetical protein